MHIDNQDYILKNDPEAQLKEFKKGTVLQRQGEVNHKGFLVKKGLLRSYIIDAKGKEHIFIFAAENWIMGDIDSQEFDHPAELFIDCVEDSEVMIFNRRCLIDSERPIELIKSEVKLLSRRVGVMQRRVLMLMSTSARERYEYFVKAYPELPHRVPQHMIASYLGITPQALSTIRKKMVSSA